MKKSGENKVLTTILPTTVLNTMLRRRGNGNAMTPYSGMRRKEYYGLFLKAQWRERTRWKKKLDVVANDKRNKK